MITIKQIYIKIHRKKIYIYNNTSLILECIMQSTKKYTNKEYNYLSFLAFYV